MTEQTEQSAFLKKLRNRWKKTQVQVSDILGLKCSQHVSNIEKGKSPLGFNIANGLIDQGLTTKKEIGNILISDYMIKVNSNLKGPSMWRNG